MSDMTRYATRDFTLGHAARRKLAFLARKLYLEFAIVHYPVTAIISSWRYQLDEGKALSSMEAINAYSQILGGDC